MPTDTQIYGFLRFQSFSAFSSDATDSSDQFVRRLLSDLTGTPPPPTPPITHWPRIIDCIQRGTEWSLTARTPAIHASIRFDPSTDSGAYEIHFPHERRRENGVVLRVRPVLTDQLLQPHYAMLAPFPTRFVVSTRSASDRQGTQQIWLVGISTFRDVSPESLANSESTNDAS